MISLPARGPNWIAAHPAIIAASHCRYLWLGAGGEHAVGAGLMEELQLHNLTVCEFQTQQMDQKRVVCDHLSATENMVWTSTKAVQYLRLKRTASVLQSDKKREYSTDPVVLGAKPATGRVHETKAGWPATNHENLLFSRRQPRGEASTCFAHRGLALGVRRHCLEVPYCWLFEPGGRVTEVFVVLWRTRLSAGSQVAIWPIRHNVMFEYD